MKICDFILRWTSSEIHLQNLNLYVKNVNCIHNFFFHYGMHPFLLLLHILGYLL